MRVPAGANLAEYGVALLCPVRRPQDGGGLLAALPITAHETALVPIGDALWHELEADGLAFIDLFCMGCLEKAHTFRVALCLMGVQ